MEKTTPECILKLRSVYNTLRPKPALVADYIFEHPEDVVSLSIGDLAMQVGVSQFSVINCIKAAGYSGFSDFKIDLALGMGKEDTLLFGSVKDDDDPYTVLTKVMQQASRSFADTIGLIDQSSLHVAVEMICSARRVVLFGRGNSCFAAEYLSFGLERLGIATVHHRDQIYQTIASENLTASDLAIVFTVTGQSETVRKWLSNAQKNGCATMIVACSRSASISQYADCVLLTSYSNPDILQDINNGFLEHMALASALTICVANRDKSSARALIQRSSSQERDQA